jgi:hypothetical protein
MLKYLLLLMLFLALLRFMNQIYRHVHNLASGFAAPNPGQVEREKKDDVRERDIEDAEYEILPEEPHKPSE